MGKTLQIAIPALICILLGRHMAPSAQARDQAAWQTSNNLHKTTGPRENILLASRHRKTSRVTESTGESPGENPEDGTPESAAPKATDTSGENQSETAAGSQPENATEGSADSAAGSQAWSALSKRSAGAASSTESDISHGKEEPHTLLYYVATTIGSLLLITVVLALLGSSSVIFPAIVWHTIKLFNGGKKPSIG